MNRLPKEEIENGNTSGWKKMTAKTKRQVSKEHFWYNSLYIIIKQDSILLKKFMMKKKDI